MIILNVVVVDGGADLRPGKRGVSGDIFVNVLYNNTG